MTEKSIAEASNADNEDMTFVEVMIVLAKHKRKILWTTVGMAIVAAAVSFALPNVYRASTKLLPPQQAQSGASALLSQLGGVASLAAGAAGLKNPTDVYLGMLRSRTIADSLIKKYQLNKVYDTDSPEKARAELAANTTIASGKDGLVEIDVDANSPKLAKVLANAYVTELLDLSRTLAVTEASQRRLFFQQQLEQAKNNLVKAEMALKGAIDVGGVVSVDTESRTVLETVARLRAQISAREVELNAMRSFVTPDHPDFRRVSEELVSLRAELAKLENGRGPTANTADDEKSGLKNIQLLRDLKYYQMLYELLAKQYEAARLDEAKDPSVIQVLDPAIEPERKISPKRALMVIVSTIATLMIMIVSAFVIEAHRRTARQPHMAERWAEFRRYLNNKAN